MAGASSARIDGEGLGERLEPEGLDGISRLNREREGPAAGGLSGTLEEVAVGGGELGSS